MNCSSLTKIKQGYKKFRETYDSFETLKNLISADQKPHSVIVSCCDSRVDPSIIFQSNPGEFFTVRNIASLIPPYEKDDKHHGVSAALEFAVNFLKVKNIIILGHTNCGGIQAMMNHNLEDNDFITHWLAVLNKNEFNGLSLCDCVKLSLRKSFENALTFPWIKEKYEANTLNIFTWYFDLQTGTINTYNDATEQYEEM